MTAHRQKIARSNSFRIELRSAPRYTLHDETFQRSDSNSPVHRHQGKLFAFVSHYLPVGHSYRRVGGQGLKFYSGLEPVRILNDPEPSVGKWIEFHLARSDRATLRLVSRRNVGPLCETALHPAYRDHAVRRRRRDLAPR